MISTLSVNERVYTRKSYDINAVVAKLVSQLVEYAHGWVTVPASKKKSIYKVHVNLATLRADYCECYDRQERGNVCKHMIAAEQYYSNLRPSLLEEPIINVYDERCKQTVPCRVSRLSHDEYDRYEAQQRADEIARRDWNVIHNYSF